MIKLYSTHCPKCRILETKLKQQNIEFEVIDDEEVMINKGFKSAPKLEINGQILDFPEAMTKLMSGGLN
jgi:glutaredoxin